MYLEIIHAHACTHACMCACTYTHLYTRVYRLCLIDYLTVPNLGQPSLSTPRMPQGSNRQVAIETELVICA